MFDSQKPDQNLDNNQSVYINKPVSNIGAFLLNAFIYPGLGELSIGRIKEGKIALIIYTIWSIIACVLSIFSIGLLVPIVFILDIAIRAYYALSVYPKMPINKAERMVETHN